MAVFLLEWPLLEGAVGVIGVSPMISLLTVVWGFHAGSLYFFSLHHCFFVSGSLSVLLGLDSWEGMLRLYFILLSIGSLIEGFHSNYMHYVRLSTSRM